MIVNQFIVNFEIVFDTLTSICFDLLYPKKAERKTLTLAFWASFNIFKYTIKITYQSQLSYTR